MEQQAPQTSIPSPKPANGKPAKVEASVTQFDVRLGQRGKREGWTVSLPVDVAALPPASVAFLLEAGIGYVLRGAVSETYDQAKALEIARARWDGLAKGETVLRTTRTAVERRAIALAAQLLDAAAKRDGKTLKADDRDKQAIAAVESGPKRAALLAKAEELIAKEAAESAALAASIDL